MAIPVILALIFVLGICFFFLAWHSIQGRHVSVSLLDQELAFNAARVTAQCFYKSLAEALRTRSGCEKLFPSAAGSFAASPLAVSPGAWFSNIRFTLTSQDLDLAEVLTEIVRRFQLVGLSASADCSMAPAPGFAAMPTWEGRIRLSVDVGSGSGNRSYRFLFPRQIRLSQSLPPVVSRFTLFLRNCADPEQFNVGESAYATGARNKSLVLVNNPDNLLGKNRIDYFTRRSGWVYIGGDSVNLNIDGSHPTLTANSEFFFFFPCAVIPGITQDIPGFLFDIPGTPHPSLKVRVTLFGCFAELLSTPELLKLYMDPDFAEAVPNLGKTSVLRLFGQKQGEAMTPTKVFGKVFARYLFNSFLIVDMDGDGIPDRDLVRNYIPSPSVRATDEFRLLFPLTRVTKENKFIPRLGIPQLHHSRYPISLTEVCLAAGIGHSGTLGELFPVFFELGSPIDYVTFMSKVSTADFGMPGASQPGAMATFNGLYDLMFQGTNPSATHLFPAPRSFNDDEYPSRGTGFTLSTAGGVVRPDLTGGGPIDLAAFDPSLPYRDYVRDRRFFTHFFPGATDFLEPTGNADASLSGAPPGAPLVVAQPASIFVGGSDPLDLSAGLLLQAPLVLVAAGDVVLGPVTVDATSPSSRRLTIVSLDGSIRLRCSPMLPTALVAPQGRISWDLPLDIQGSLCAGELDPALLKGQGGRVAYNPDLDPTVAENAFRGLVTALGPELDAKIVEKIR